MLPSDNAAAVERTLARVINDTAVKFSADTATPSPASPLRPDVLAAVEASVKAIWGNVPVTPYMETGATDGLYLRNAGIPVYAFSGIFLATDDIRAHGKDERVLISSFDDALDFTYDFLKRIAK